MWIPLDQYIADASKRDEERVNTGSHCGKCWKSLENLPKDPSNGEVIYLSEWSASWSNDVKETVSVAVGKLWI